MRPVRQHIPSRRYELQEIAQKVQLSMQPYGAELAGTIRRSFGEQKKYSAKRAPAGPFGKLPNI
jgi:hypothetical protein